MPDSSARWMVYLTGGLLLLTLVLQPLLPSIEVFVQQTSNQVERWVMENSK